MLIKLVTAVTSQLIIAQSSLVHMAHVYVRFEDWVMSLKSLEMQLRRPLIRLLSDDLDLLFPIFTLCALWFTMDWFLTTRNPASDIVVAFNSERGKRDVWYPKVPLGRLARFSE